MALLIAPLLGSPCAGPFGEMFGINLLGIFAWIVSGLDESPPATGLKSTTAWEARGPYGGPVRYGLAIDRNNPNVIYAASSGGVFKSTDGGATWTLSSAGIVDMFEVHAVAIDPSNSSTVYAGSADSNLALFKSTDGGAHWTSISNGLFAGTITSIAVHPTTPSIIVAGSPLGLWRTSDGGANWARITSVGEKLITVVAFDRTNPSTVYAMTSGAGVYKSTNAGVDWSASNTGFAPNGALLATGGTGFAIDPVTSTRLYAGAYRSTNGGASWTPMSGVGTNVGTLAVDLLTPNTVYATDNTGGAYRSTDAGVTWAAVNNGLANLSVWSVATHPKTSGTVFVTNDQGIWKSTNGGTSWSAANNGLANTNVEAVVVDPFAPSTVYAGTYSNGIFRSTDAGNTWVNVLAGTPATMQVMGMEADRKTPGTLYAANAYSAVLKSTDRGATWTSVRVNGRPLSIVIDPVVSSTLYVGTVGDGVFKSVDSGANWTQVNTGLPRRPENASIVGAIEGLSVSTKDRSVWAWVQTGESAFSASISRDGGATWSASYPGWDPSVKLSGPKLLDFLTNTVGLKSIGANFQTPQYGGLPTCMPISQVVADPFESTLGYAAGSCGVGRAKYANGTLTAVQLPANTPPYVYANALAITPTGSDLYAGMQWGGVYKLTLDASPRVVEYYLAERDHYFITADPIEQAAVDSGAAGPFYRTGAVFKAGGSTPVCRFFGNTNINPATGAFYGPTSHFYTADANECAGLKAQFVANAKAWKFESNDFLTTPASAGTCPASTTPVYRAYNNAFIRGADSNHRITSDLAAYQAQVAKGWIGEGIVMCAPK